MNIDDFLSFSREKEAFKKLISGFCPDIYGNESVKAGILLTLFGGSINCHKSQTRSNSHLIIVGDPGMGKSHMLVCASQATSRGIYVCGNSSSVVGLTASITSSGEGEDYSLEAGALVLADRGVCCIDEFDKMNIDFRALLQVLEQQQVNIAKAGIVCSLPARCSVIAAANPINGHFDSRKNIAENVKLPPAIISRFDLVFILQDVPNREFDKKLAEKVFTRSQMSDKEDRSVVSINFIRQYIAYAREHCNPKLSVEAATVLQHFYLNIKKNPQSFEFPVTIR